MAKITEIIATLTLIQPFDVLSELGQMRVIFPRSSGNSQEEQVKTLDIELDPDGLDSNMTLLTHRYFRLPETATASIVLKAVQTLLGSNPLPNRLFLTTGHAQKVVLKGKMALRDVKWLVEQGEGKKIVLYYTSKS